MDNSSDGFLGLHDFLDRMRQPSAAEFVRSIKSFIVAFTNNPPDPDRDSALVQDFLAKMESAFRTHPLWAGCSEGELESAGEGLEKYVMTKLFSRVFATSPDDVNSDSLFSHKTSLVQQFVLPQNLDIKPTFQNESSWVLAQKELQKINMYKAPRDKLMCILTCCKVINNLLLNASMAANENPPGADEFLPVLIYVTIKANPPNLHSNLAYISRYRRQSKLVAESAYFLTNMLSAESFIVNIDAKSLSMEEDEFEKHMELSRALASDVDELSSQIHTNDAVKEEPKPETKFVNEDNVDQPVIAKVPSVSDIENRGAEAIMEETEISVFREYPYLYARAGDLTVADVDDLLSKYKELVLRYVCLTKGLGEDESCAAGASGAESAVSDT